MSALFTLLLFFSAQADEEATSSLRSRCSDAAQEVDCGAQDEDASTPETRVNMLNEEWGYDGETFRQFTPEERLAMKKAELEEVLAYAALLRDQIAALEAEVASEEE